MGSLLLAAGTPAHAEDLASFSLRLQAPSDARCPAASELTQAVERRIGRVASPPDAAADAELEIDVQIAAMPVGYRALVSVVDRASAEIGRRELRVDGACVDLTQMLTLVIATSVGIRRAPPPAAAERSHEPDQSAERRAAENVPVASVETSPAEPTFVHDSAPPGAWSFDAEAGLRMISGITARPSFGPTLGVWSNHGSLRLGLAGTWLAPMRDAVATGLSMRASGAWGELALCGLVAQLAHTDVAVCAATQIGALHATPLDLARASPRWDAFMQLAASVHARWSLSPWLAVSFAIGAAMPVVYPRYSYVDQRGAQQMGRAVALGVWGAISLSLRIQPRKTPEASGR